MGSAPPREGCERHRLCSALQLAMVLLLQGPRTTHFATGLCGFYANGAAPAGLLPRTRQWCIYARSERCHCTASKELFDARYGNTYRSRTARIAHALTRHGGRSSATPNDSPPNTACVLVLTGVRPSICRAVSFIAFPSHRSKPYGPPSLSLRIMRERPCETL